MSEKTYKLVIGISGAVATAASAIVTFFEPTYMTAIVASIGVAETALVEIVSMFKENK